VSVNKDDKIVLKYEIEISVSWLRIFHRVEYFTENISQIFYCCHKECIPSILSSM